MRDEFPNLNTLWCGVLVEALNRKGVETAIVCPGSRSSPLAFAFDRCGGIESVPVLDERSAGFFALGIARRTGRPVALVCTSGSAVANLFPAVVEASESGVPLILLTADRPPELRQCAAGQTIDQIKVYGSFVRYANDLSLPENKLGALRYLRQTISFAVERAFAPDAGPVHLNLPLRDPLAPVQEEGFAPCLTSASWAGFLAELTVPRPLRFADATEVKKFVRGSRGLLVVGPSLPQDEERWIDHLAAFANALQWPVLADPLSPVRTRASRFETLVCGYEFALRSKRLRPALQPERVLVVNELPTCKTMREWLSELDLPLMLIGRRSRNADPTHSRSSLVRWNLDTDPLPEVMSSARSEFCERWLEMDRVSRDAVDERMEGESAFFEGKVSWLLARALPADSALCVSNSMPPRDLESYFGPTDQRLDVYSSRGANGIDGILSTALGVAHRGKPTCLLIGDLAMLHDTNGGLLFKEFEGSLTIALVDNSGGGIFEMLPVSQYEPVFSKYFVTDQGIAFSQWAETYGADFERVESWETFIERLREPREGVRILALVTDRQRDGRRRKQWFREIADELEQVFELPE